MKAIWSAYVRSRVETNSDHERYFFCFDNNDPDVVIAFQIFSSEAAMKTFLAGDWYPEYLEKVAECIEEPPTITEASPIWTKE